MSKPMRRQSAQQRLATIFGGILVLAVVVVLVTVVIQGSRRPHTPSIMQRALSAQTAPYHFISENASVEDGVVHIQGYFGGIPDDVPETEATWQQLVDEVSKVYAKDMTGVAQGVHVEFYHKGELMAVGTAPVK